MRLRDVGGLIVIDFIDMESQKNQRAVEDRLRDAVKQDRARIQLGRISKFGLLELSRQRLRPSISESTNITCPRCNGMGVIRSVESLALAILRLIGEEARKDRTAKVIAQLPVDVATYLMNEKRDWLQSIESRSSVDVILVPNRYIDTPAYEIRRVRDDELGLPEYSMISHQMAVQPQIDLEAIAAEEKAPPPPPVPAVTTVVPSTPAPPPAPEPVATPVAVAPVVVAQYGPRDGALVRLWRWLVGDKRAPEPVPPPARGEREHGRDRDRGRDGHRDRDRERGRDRDRERGRDRDRDARPARDEQRRDGRRDERGARDEQRREGRRDEPRSERKDGERRPEQQQQPRRDERGGDRSRRPEQQGQGRDGQRERRPDGQPRGSQQRQDQPPRAEQVQRPEQAPPVTAVTPMVPVADPGEAQVTAGENAAIDAAATPRTDRPDRPEGERGGRRSRRGGRRRRREGGGEAGVRDSGGGEAEGSDAPGDAPASESRSFDFEREPSSQAPRPVEAAPAPRPLELTPPTPSAAPPAPPVVHEPREWTPSPPSDVTREAPRSEP
jgi:ribonuclease E